MKIWLILNFQEWQFICPLSVQIPFSVKFKLTPEELHQYKEVDNPPHPNLAFEPTNGQHDSFYLHLSRRPLHSFPPPRQPAVQLPTTANPHPPRGHIQPDSTAAILPSESNSTTFDLDEFRGSDALKVNVILSDSLLNLFKDHNFDSCNICECTTSVLGMEFDIYVSGPAPPPPRSCNCGFSARVNRKFALAGTLCWEDEMEVASLSIANVDLGRLHPRKPSPLPSGAVAYLPILTQWMRGPLEEFGVRFLVEWLQHTDNVITLEEMRQGTYEKDALLDYNGGFSLCFFCFITPPPQKKTEL